MKLQVDYDVGSQVYHILDTTGKESLVGYARGKKRVSLIGNVMGSKHFIVVSNPDGKGRRTLLLISDKLARRLR